MALFLYSAIAIWGFQCLLFIIALLKKNNGIADIGWGLGFIVIVALACRYYFFKWLYATLFSEEALVNPFFVLLVSLVLIWALRLSFYLLIRNWGKPEDWRYAKWRQDWGKSFFIRSFLQVFVLQGFFMLVIGSPIIFSALDSGANAINFSTLQYFIALIGLVLWLIGFFFQAVGDYQLFVFKKDPTHKGRIMRYGIWRYTRHPNYFGEATMWWGVFLISCVSAHGIVGILLRLIGPATITFMLLRVSGVTMLESKYKGNEEYEDYQKNTSSFIPMPLRKN
jgi:steroid 5-alpha reductase family enzyme